MRDIGGRWVFYPAHFPLWATLDEPSHHQQSPKNVRADTGFTYGPAWPSIPSEQIHVEMMLENFIDQGTSAFTLFTPSVADLWPWDE